MIRIREANENKASFNEQEWNCGLSAVVDALSLMGLEVTYEQIFSRYVNLGFKIHHFGISSIHLALLIRCYGFPVILRTHSKWLRELWDFKKKHSLSNMIEVPKESADTLKAMEMFTDMNGRIHFYTKYTNPNIKSVLSSLKKRFVVVLCVSANYYYGINENWNHYLVLKKDDVANSSFHIIDPLQNIGKMYYPEWDDYLRTAKKYNWSNWSGDMIEVLQQ